MNRQQRRALERKSSGIDSTPALDKLVQATKPGILANLARRDIDPKKHVLIALAGTSPINERLPVAKRLAFNQLGVDFVERATLSEALLSFGSLSLEVAEPAACGHFQILLGTKEDGRFCCTQCDLKIERPS